MCLTTFFVVLKFTPCAKMFSTFILKIMSSKIINNTVSIPIRIPPRIHMKSYCPLYLDGKFAVGSQRPLSSIVSFTVLPT